MTLRAVPDHVRPPAVAGRFYADRAETLSAEVDGLLQRAAPLVPPHVGPPVAIVVPHAGYGYSGHVAAVAYELVRARRPDVTRVAVLGPAHRVGVTGIAVPSADAFATPLGVVLVDREARAEALTHAAVHVDDRAHAGEHAIEVQLPFLQRCLGEVSLLPVLAGHAGAELVADVLRPLWGTPGTLVVVSTDLSHGLDAATAAHVDAETIHAVLELDESALAPDRACGVAGLRGALLLAEERSAAVTLLAHASSAEAGGDPDAVVGYASFAMTPG